MAKELKFVMLLDCYGDLLTERQHSMMELYYCEDLSLAEIGEPLDITRQAVRSIIKRTEEILLNYEEKLGFAEKLGSIRERLERIETAAGKITDESVKNEITHEIEEVQELL